MTIKRMTTQATSLTYFCSSSLARSSKSSGLNCDGEDGERAGVDSVVDEDVVCKEADGLATWLAIWLTVCDTVFFTHEEVELNFFCNLVCKPPRIKIKFTVFQFYFMHYQELDNPH